MVADAFIQCRVSAQTKRAFQIAAQRAGLTESALLKELVDFVLRSGDSLVASGDVDDRVRMPRGRLSVRLQADDRLLLRERADARGMPAATYVSVLLRAHLRSLAPLPRQELQALKRSASELAAIGRNLNQIARTGHQGAQLPVPAREELRALLKVCEALRDHIRELVKANVTSWVSGYVDSHV